MTTPQNVLAYWLDEIGPKGWYEGGEALDADIRDKFLDVWTKAAEGHLGFWLTCPSETLAYLIVTDQFSRNMHRGSEKAFQTDPWALAAAKMAIDRDWDLKIDEPARQFFYMPLVHSENLCDQDRAVRLMHMRLSGTDNLDHAKVHREIIRRFGRFPYRNEALGRTSTDTERAFIDGNGYREILDEIKSPELA